MTDATQEREIGRLQAQVENLQNQQEDMNRKLDELLAFMSSAKGSWKALVAVGGISAALTSIIMKLWVMVAK